MKKLLFVFLLGTGCIQHRVCFQKEQAVVVNMSSGFKIAQYVVTANHVATEDTVIVSEQNNTHYFGYVIARDTANDIALIEPMMKSKYWDYTPGTPSIRGHVYAISNPMLLEYSEVEGEVQNVDRRGNGKVYIQIGIDVYYGSSGSAVFNGHGQIIGMIVQAIPGTRFTFLVPFSKIDSLIRKTNHYETH